MTLTPEQILAFAPDAASAKAGTQLASPATWSELGQDARSVWGACQGSGKIPYRTQIDIGEPAFKCTCPSRKFPCKHGLGLYLLRSSHPALFADSSPPQWVQDWLDSRQLRQEKKAEKTAPSTPAQAETNAAQARKREEKRDQNVDRGLAELQTWLHDLAREGLAGVRERGPAFWDGMAARLVDAQAGVLGARLRRAGALCYQATLPDAERRLANELASIYLLTQAWSRIDTLPAPLQRDIRNLIGFTVAREEVLAEPAVADRWLVLSQRSSDDGRIRTRATWLAGVASRRWALLLQHAAGAQGFEQNFSAGTEFDGELCFYPGALPLRALVRQQSPVMPLASALPAASSVATLLDTHADALARQPFLESLPVLLADMVPDTAARTVRDHAGAALALHPAFRHDLHLAALSGGHPVTIMGEWDGEALLPLAIRHGGRLFNLDTDLLP